jgi:hypothetical protein
MNIKSGSAKLVLLCPAWKRREAAKTVKPGTAILMKAMLAAWEKGP